MRIENETLIAAPPFVVWSVTADIERWPEWTPTVTRVRLLDDGALATGSRVELKQPAMPVVTWEVTDLVPGSRFTWVGALRGMRMEATHELMPRGDSTRNVLRLELSGWVTRALGPLMRWSVARALRQENAGLRARCEALAQRTRSGARTLAPHGAQDVADSKRRS
jgi:uncharacterized protein YndB with AHSA1/START domain